MGKTQLENKATTTFIPLMSPDITMEDINAVSEVLKSGRLVQGEKVSELEESIARYLNIKHVIAVSSGTATLHLALIALGISGEDEVIVPAFSFMATANVVELVGAKPVFVDINIDTFNIDSTKIESAITSRTRAIIVVHEFGLAAEIGEIISIANKYGLSVIEDSACALGATENSQYAGTFGIVGSFSLHPRKTITSGEGGVLVTNNDDLANKFRILRNHGAETKNRKTEFILPGYNYRMTDFQAALVNSQFKRFEKIIEYKSIIAQFYLNNVKNSKIKIPYVPANKKHTWQTFHVLLDSSLERDEIIDCLMSKNIGTNYGAQCMPFQKYFLEKYKLNCKELFPCSMLAYKQGLAIPLHTKLTEDNAAFIVEQLNKI